MTKTYKATFTGFTGWMVSVEIRAVTLEEAEETCQAHMCAGDLLTVEEV